MMDNPDNYLICAFCKGQGLDPFDIMSASSVCEVCGGSGNVRVRPPRAGCAFCSGSGVQPGKRLTCGACGGKGAQTVREPVIECDRCSATGREPASPLLYCVKCHGVGLAAGAAV
ncbi:MAG: hypothetical protein U0990_03595 [Candidatus Nanopelagicales bacterium]|nr:hypothetical protein [Candidatus Nanopelagicales bacterium]MDZ4249158.1 hypothetical protein [Candidatus Nanopelagicales bacterium]MDZ7577390.1 hypothetical protein [Candidatus Nanopelagicales bacterium]